MCLTTQLCQIVVNSQQTEKKETHPAVNSSSQSLTCYLLRSAIKSYLLDSFKPVKGLFCWVFFLFFTVKSMLTG